MAPASWIKWAIGALAAIGLTALWTSYITDERIDGDDLQTLTMAVNLRYHGVASLDTEAPFTPSMYREPVPVVTTALAMAAADAILGPAGPDAYLAGERARLVKLQNVAWLAVLCVAAFWAVHVLTSSVVLGLIAVALMNFDVIPLAEVGLAPMLLDSIMSESLAAALMLAASALLVTAWRSGSLRRFAAAGAVFGLLALTKAAFFYVALGLGAALLLVAVVELRGSRRLGRLAGVAVLVAAFAAAVVPWMARNYVALGELQIAERGGVVLYLRALKNAMTSDEYRGAYYFWAPEPLRPLVGSMLGFSAEDLKRGGRLERLNRLPNAEFYAADIAAWRAAKPEEAITFIRKALAEQLRLERIAAQDASAEPADVVLQRRAAEMIGADPGSHLKTTPLFLWRGAFFPFPLLAAALLYALWRRNSELVVFALPAFGAVMFFALLTHYLPRYSTPMYPVAVVLTVVFAGTLAASLRRTTAHSLQLKWMAPRGVARAEP